MLYTPIIAGSILGNMEESTNTSREDTDTSMGASQEEKLTTSSMETDSIVHERPSALKAKTPKKKKVAIAAAVLLIVVGAVGAWYMMHKPKPAARTNSSTQVDNTNTAPSSLSPATVMYSYKEKTGVTPAGCGEQEKDKLYWRPVAGGDKTQAADTAAGSTVAYSGVYKNEAFVVTYPACGSKDGVTILYSQDAGKTYSNIFSGAAASGDGLADQITSAHFSSDGSAIVFGYLRSDSIKNTVKEIDPSSKVVKDLFTDDKHAGIFLHGYNKGAGRIYYSVGCFNCDGVSYDKVLVYDTAANTSSELYDDSKAGKTSEQVVMNSDLSKILRVRGTVGEFMGGSAPYTIEEFDIATKTAKQITEIKEDTMVSVGYRSDDGVPYFSSKNTVSIIGSAAQPEVVFEASKPIIGVYHVSVDKVVASSGTYSDFVLTNYLVDTKQTVTLLSGDDKTNIFGVGWQ